MPRPVPTVAGAAALRARGRLFVAAGLVLAAGAGLAAAPKAKAEPPPSGERALDVLRRADGGEAGRFIGLPDGGLGMRFPDGGAEAVPVHAEPRCTVDAGALLALANGCSRSLDCAALEPHLFGVDSCVAVLGEATASGAYGRAREAAVASGRMPDGGACPDVHQHTLTLGGCRAACVKGVCVVKQSRFE